MADDLGARLLRAGLVTRAQLGAVLGGAPPHDGALAVGLVDDGLSEDALCGFFVSLGLGPLLDAGDLASAQPRALAALPASMALALHALPVRYGAAGLVVAMAAPTDRHTIAELRRAARVEVLPTVARVSELRAALERAYPGGSARWAPEVRESEPPVLELVNVRKPGRSIVESAEGYLGSTRGAERVEARHMVGPRLAPDDDEGFVPLVRTKPVSSRTPAFGVRKSITKTFERPSRKPDGDDAVGATAWAKGSSAPPAPPDAPAPARQPSPVARVTRPAPTAGTLPPASAPEPARPPKPPPRSIIPPEHASWDVEAPANKVDPSKLRSVAPPPPRSQRPAPVGGIVSAIRATRDRDEVVELACQGALTVSRAAVLLALRKSVLKGWGGSGAGLSRDGVRNLWIPTHSPSVFRDVVAHAEPFRGPHGTTAADGLFRAALERRGGELVVQPVRVAGKVVAVLAADDLRHGDEGVERIEILARAVGEAFERIIVDKRR